MNNILRKRIVKISAAVLSLLLLSTVLIVAALYRKYVDKESNLVLYTSPDNTQQIYILGTIHEYHFNPLLGYAYPEVQNVLDLIKPDLLLLEVDQEVFERYGVIKSPIEMIPLWCRATESGIPVKGIDWFEVTKDSRSWTTDKIRDDHIFNRSVAAIGSEAVVLIIVGATHRIEQANRFEAEGFQRQEIADKSLFFGEPNIDEFKYPAATVAEVDKQIEYWRTTAPEKAIAVTDASSRSRSYWLNHYQKLIDSLLKIRNNILS